MKVIALLLGLAAVVAAVQQPLKTYIVSYEDNTPPSVLEEAKQSIIDAGGKIVHQFDIITGFVVTATSEAMTKLRAVSADYQPAIEEDAIVHASD